MTTSPLARRVLDEYAGAADADPVRLRRLEDALAPGLPTARDENWKYANLRGVERARFRPPASLDPASVDAARLQLPAPLQNINESLARLITTGFLPQRFRDEMKLQWNTARQREFDALMATVRLGNGLAPSFVRNFPFNLLLHDVNWRMRTGRPLV